MEGIESATQSVDAVMHSPNGKLVELGIPADASETLYISNLNERIKLDGGPNSHPCAPVFFAFCNWRYFSSSFMQ